MAAAEAQSASPGLDDLTSLRAGGYSPDELNSYKADTTAQLVKGGYSQQEIAKYWGDPDPAQKPDLGDYKTYVNKNLDQYKAENQPTEGEKPKEAGSFLDAWNAGWERSVSPLPGTLFSRGKMPDTVLPENAGMAMKIISAMGQAAGDLPVMAASAWPGAMAGAPVGGAAGSVVPGVGTLAGIAAGATIGGAASAMAIPEGMRQLLIQQYQKGEIKNPEDFMARLSAATHEAIKAGGIGLATAGTGRFVGPVAEGIAGPTAGKLAQFGSEVGAMTAAGSAMAGKMPTFEDFAVNAVSVGGLHAVATVAPKLMGIYAKTGETPQEVAAKANEDPTIKQDLMSEDPEHPKIAVPSIEEQQKLGLFPVDKNGKIVVSPGEPLANERGAVKVGEPEAEPLTNDEKTMLNRIGENQQSEGKSIGDRWRGFRINNIDAYEELKNLGNDDAYIKARLFNAVNDRVYSFLNGGTRDFKTGEVNGEAINKIFDENQKVNNDPNNQRLAAYWMARRGLDLDKRGIESMFTNDDEYQAAKRLVKQNANKYQPYVDRLVEAKNKVIDYYAASGRITQEAAEKIKSENENHLALHTVQDLDEITGAKKGSGQPLKKIYGSLAKKIDPITSTYKDIEMLIKHADRNRVRQATVPDPDNPPEYIREVKPDMERIKIQQDEIQNQLGIKTDKAMTLFRPEKLLVGDNQFPVWYDGKMRVFQSSPEVIKAMKSLDGNYQALPAWGKMMSFWAKTLRLGTLSNPAFPIRHYIRSQRGAGIFSQTGMIPYFHPALSLMDFFKQPESYKNWIYDGGAVRGWDHLNNISTEYGGEEPSWLKRTWNYVPKTLKGIAHVNESFIQLTDNLARYTEYKRAVGQGYTREQAAYLGRNVTADYQRMGAERSALYSMVPFLRAHIQISDRALQEATSPVEIPRPGIDSGRYSTQSGFDPRLEFAAKAFAGYTIPALLLYAATHDDSRIKNSAWWKKMMMLQFPIDHWREASDPMEYSLTPDDLKAEKDGRQFVNDGPVLRIPVAGEPELMFGSGPVAALEAYKQKDPTAIKEWAKNFLGSAAVVPIPTAILPPIEQWANKNWFTGHNIVSWQKEKELPEDQQDEYTSEAAKKIGQALGYVPMLKDLSLGGQSIRSPMVIDNYIHDWFGSTGQIVNNALNSLQRSSGPVQPEKSWYQEPFVKEFFDKFPNARPQIIDDFHEKFKEADEAMNSIKDYEKQGNAGRVMEIWQKYGQDYESLKGYNDYIKSLGSMVQKTLATDFPGDTNGHQKRQILDKLYFEMLSTASVGLQTMKGGGKNATGGQ